MAVSLQHALSFSDDAGETWKGPGPAAKLPDGRTISTDIAHVPLVEGNTVTFFAYALIEKGYQHWMEGHIWGAGFVRRYDLDKHEWGDPLFLNEKWVSAKVQSCARQTAI